MSFCLSCNKESFGFLCTQQLCAYEALINATLCKVKLRGHCYLPSSLAKTKNISVSVYVRLASVAVLCPFQT